MKTKNKYTKRQIENTIKYWKKILSESKVKDSDEEKIKDTSDKSISDKKTKVKADAKDKAAAKEILAKEEKAETPIGDFNLMLRMHRLHNGAVKKVREALGQFLLKQKAGSPETVTVKNSCDKDGSFEMPDDGKMYITISIKLDKAQLSGFRKMVALMKENEEAFYDSYVNEGFFGDFVAGLKKGATALAGAAKETAQAMGATAKEKLQTAQEKLKKNIGVEAMKTYVTSFCGKKLGDQVNLKNIAINQDEEGTDDAEITFTSLINIK